MSVASSLEVDAASIDPKALRRCLGQYPTGVTIITTVVDGVTHGVTANSFASLSMDPPLILWAIGRRSRSFAAFQKARRFVVNILSADQVAHSQQFSNSASIDKFKGIEWLPGIDGSPVLSGAAAHLDCRLTSRSDGGDHVILIGEVQNFTNSRKPPLLFTQGRYGVSADHPDGRIPFSFRSVKPDGGPLDTSLSGLMYRAYASLTSTLDTIRGEIGLSHMEARLMTAMATYPQSTLETLMPMLLAGRNEIESVYADLLGRGLIATDSQGGLRFTSRGKTLFDRLIAQCIAAERASLSNVSDADVAASRRMMAALIDSRQEAGVDPARPMSRDDHRAR